MPCRNAAQVLGRKSVQTRPMIAGVATEIVVGKTQVRVVRTMEWNPVFASKTLTVAKSHGLTSAASKQVSVWDAAGITSADREKPVPTVQQIADATQHSRCVKMAVAWGSVATESAMRTKRVTPVRANAEHVREDVV